MQEYGHFVNSILNITDSDRDVAGLVYEPGIIKALADSVECRER